MGEGSLRFYTIFERTSHSRTAACCPPPSGRDPFYVEDKEVLEALGRILSGEETVCASPEETQLHELVTRWESLIRGAGEEERIRSRGKPESDRRFLDR